MNLNAIIEKIKKLQALANSSNKHEAALAATKMQKLLMQHNLDLETVENHAEASPYIKDTEILDCNRLTKGWKSDLYAVIASNNFCTLLTVSGSPKVSIVGKKHNLEIVRYLYHYLEREIERLATKAAESQYSGRAAYIRGFSLGAVHTIGNRLWEAKKDMAEQSDCRALIVKSDAELKSAVEREFGKVGTAKWTKTGNAAAYQAGRRAGREIPIHEGVAGQEKQQVSHVA